VFTGKVASAYCIITRVRLLPRDKQKNINDQILMMVMARFMIFHPGFTRTQSCWTFAPFYRDVSSKEGAFIFVVLYRLKRTILAFVEMLARGISQSRRSFSILTDIDMIFRMTYREGKKKCFSRITSFDRKLFVFLSTFRKYCKSFEQICNENPVSDWIKKLQIPHRSYPSLQVTES